VALGRGGATETITPGVTGFLVDQPTPDAFAEAMRAVTRSAFDSARLVSRAGDFAVGRFESGFRQQLSDTLAEARAC
jgi:glycosyltransferase involved in cell wall biosynthesis